MFKSNARNVIDKDAFDPRPNPSRFVDVTHTPDDLDQLPNTLTAFSFYFYKQVKWPIFIAAILYISGYIIMSFLPVYARSIISIFENATDRDNLWPQLTPIILSFVFWVIFFQSACYHGGRYVWAHLGWAFRSIVLYQLNVYIKKHALSYFQNDFAGRIAHKINDVSDGLRNMMRDSLFGLSYGCVQFISALFFGNMVDPLFMIIFAIFMSVYALILVYFLPRLLKSSMRCQDSKTNMSGKVVDAISNIYTLKVFSRNAFENERMEEQLNDLTRKGRTMSFGFNKMYMCLEINNVFLWISSFGLLIWQIQAGNLQISDAALIVPVVLSIGQIVWWIADALLVFLEMAGTVKDGMQTLVKPLAITDAQNAPTLSVDKGRIEFKDVNFTYTERPVFEGLNIDIKPGQKIGLIGPSGAGKSTLVQLLLRLHDIQSGAIEIDGQDIKSVTQDSLRTHIAVIPQSSDLLHRSIRENIRYGRLEASEEEIIAAAKRAHAHDFILQLRDHEGRTGYDAMVGERGVKLSGGQRQRIAIARAVLKDAPILLLDEATSALDSESERLIQESLQELMVGRTVIAIAHRLSTIAQLDRLLVMEDGQIIEDGTHYELLEKKGLYARLWALQSGGFLPEG